VAYGLCDVAGCSEKTFMGWRPHTVGQEFGRQICRGHWERHKDQRDSSSLFEAFGYPRPEAAKVKAAEQPVVRRCACGDVLLPRRRFCKACAAERERDRKMAWWDRHNDPLREIEVKARLECRRCGGEREPGHTYCAQCAKASKNEWNRRWAKEQRKAAMITTNCRKSGFEKTAQNAPDGVKNVVHYP
jgi:uncharacterized OB-fold protein